MASSPVATPPEILQRIVVHCSLVALPIPRPIPTTWATHSTVFRVVIVVIVRKSVGHEQVTELPWSTEKISVGVSLDEMRLLLYFPNGAFTCSIDLMYLLGGNKRIPCTETQHCALGLQALLHWGNWGWGKLACAGGGGGSSPFPGPPPLLGPRDGDPQRADRGGWGRVLRYHNIFDSK